MVHRKEPTARYKIIVGREGNRYRFFCEASGAAVCTTAPLKADTQEKELALAWQEGKRHLSLCPECGRYVCDAMYNADVCKCVDCAPWETLPNYCSGCGRAVPHGETFCGECGKRTQYGEVWA